VGGTVGSARAVARMQDQGNSQFGNRWGFGQGALLQFDDVADDTHDNEADTDGLRDLDYRMVRDEHGSS
jgi:hypothetical protein